MTIRLKSMRHTGSRLSLVRIESRRISTSRGPAAAHTNAPTHVAHQHRCQTMRSGYHRHQEPRRTARRSRCGPPRTNHHGPDRCTERTGNPDSKGNEVSQIGEKPVLDVGSQSVNVTDLNPQSLRCERCAPIALTRSKHTLTAEDVLSASHRFAWFPSVSRTRRARSAVPPHPRRRSDRCGLVADREVSPVGTPVKPAPHPMMVAHGQDHTHRRSVHPRCYRRCRYPTLRLHQRLIDWDDGPRQERRTRPDGDGPPSEGVGDVPKGEQPTTRASVRRLGSGPSA